MTMQDHTLFRITVNVWFCRRSYRAPVKSTNMRQCLIKEQWEHWALYWRQISNK